MNLKIILGIPLIAVFALIATIYPKYWWVLLFGVAIFLKKTWFSMISNSEDVDNIKQDNKLRDILESKESTIFVQKDNDK